jgi:hypothetical protein
MSFASFLRFWAAAANRNSSFACVRSRLRECGRSRDQDGVEEQRRSPVSWRKRRAISAVRIESRQAHQALKSPETHKADRNDARGLAHLVRMGSFKPVYAKSLSATPSAADHCGPRSWSVGWCPQKIKFVALRSCSGVPSLPP